MSAQRCTCGHYRFGHDRSEDRCDECSCQRVVLASAVTEWRAVVGYEGLYEVSNDGRVRALARTVTTKRGPRTYRAQLLKPSLSSGYPAVNLRSQSLRIHRLVLEAFVGACPEGHEVRHLNGDRRDNRLENLCYGTHSENMADMVDHGTHISGLGLAAKRRTHCPQGHEYSEVNTYISPQGHRRCRRCHRERMRKTSQVCYFCGGSGEVQAVSVNNRVDWSYAIPMPCPRCH